MANSFLLLGYQPQSEEEIKMTETKEKLYEYYGIPYGVIDGAEKRLLPHFFCVKFDIR